jgi:prepilin-type processing-associated H-X9-DG protein
MRGVGLVVAVAAFAVGRAGAQGPAAGPPTRYIPAEGLVACVEFDGLAAHRAAWEATAARSILNETTTGAMLRAMVDQLVEASDRRGGGGFTGEEALALAEHVIDHGFALGVGMPSEGRSIPTVVVAVPGAGAVRFRETIDAVLKSTLAGGPVAQTVTRPDGRRLSVLRGRGDDALAVSWFEGDDWISVLGAGSESDARVREVLAGRAASAADAPTRADLARVEGGFTPVLRAWVDTTVLPPTPPGLGLEGLKGVDYRWGFAGKELVGVLRLEAPAPRAGLLRLLDQPAITAEEFPPIPAGTREYFVASLDLARALEILREAAEALGPEAKQQADALLAQIEAQTGRPLREDLAAFGPVTAGYVERVTIENSILPFGVMAQWLFRLPPAVLMARVHDAGRATGALDTMAEIGNAMIGMAGVPDAPRLEKVDDGYRLRIPEESIPLPTSIDPGVVLGTRYVALSTNRAAARRAAAGGAGESIDPGGLLRPGTVFVAVNDPRPVLPELVANLPFLARVTGLAGSGRPMPVVISNQNPLGRVRIGPELIPDPEAIRARLFPGSTMAVVDDRGLTITSRESVPSPTSMSGLPLLMAFGVTSRSVAVPSAEKAQSINNLKQIALAWANYESAYGKYPADIRDPDGNPLLSWRVAILPFLEQQALYNEFHLDEPWDSEHNRALVEQMPPVYAAPGGRGGAEPGHTFYQGFRGPGAMFDPEGKPVGLATITDGTSNTIGVAEAGAAAPWSAPEDIAFDPNGELPELGGLEWPGGFNVSFVDGSVRFLRETLNAAMLKALITRSGGEVINLDEIE